LPSIARKGTHKSDLNNALTLIHVQIRRRAHPEQAAAILCERVLLAAPFTA
jgi:hypothetical protein